MRRGRRPIFDARFVAKDCFGEWIGDINIVRQVGIDADVGNGVINRFKSGGFDIVTMMFSMHYSFESEDKVKNMLRNVAGSLKRGGRFIGVVPNSDSLAKNIKV
ncbi:MAG: mRNA cap guanine-N7 methyltransferase, partial [Watsoniomyces obsoletus]